MAYADYYDLQTLTETLLSGTVPAGVTIVVVVVVVVEVEVVVSI